MKMHASYILKLPILKHLKRTMLVCFLFLLIPAGLRAKDKLPLAPADTASPRDTLNSFIDSCSSAYQMIKYRQGRTKKQTMNARIAEERIMECLDLSHLPEFLRTYTARKAALCLKETLDRIPLPPPGEIPGKNEVASPDVKEILSYTIPHTEIRIVHMLEGPQQGEYLFSADTVHNAEKYYTLVKDMPYKPGSTEKFYEWYLSEPGRVWLSRIVHILPEWMSNRYYGQALWQWTALAITILVSFTAMYIAFKLGRKYVQREDSPRLVRYGLTMGYPIAAMLIPLAARRFLIEAVNLTGSVMIIVQICANVTFLIAAILVILGAFNRLAEAIISSPKIHPKGIDAQLTRLLCRVLGLVSATVLFLEGGKKMGIPITTLLAGAGVGGLAVALAAQDSLRNVFGSMMIILDKPFKVGERIVAKGYDGVVEEIGLRSTKIRLLTGHQVSIPNDELARNDVENVGRRPHIRKNENIPLALDIAPEKAPGQWK